MYLGLEINERRIRIRIRIRVFSKLVYMEKGLNSLKHRNKSNAEALQ